MTRAEHLFEILGELDEDLVEEAAQPAAVRRERHWGRWAALAACALLAAGLWNLSQLRMGSSGDAASGPGAEDAVSGNIAPAEPDPSEIAGVSDPGADSDASWPLTNGPEYDGPSAYLTQPAASAAPQDPAKEMGGMEDMGMGGETWPAIPYREEDVLPEDAGSSPELDELNRALEETIRTGGVPSELDVYKDGQTYGPPYPLISEEQARSLLPDGDRAQTDGAQASNGELRYAATSRGFLLPCWRFTLPDGSMRVIPAVEERYLRTGD